MPTDARTERAFGAAGRHFQRRAFIIWSGGSIAAAVHGSSVWAGPTSLRIDAFN
jgi:hypothetical protein